MVQQLPSRHATPGRAGARTTLRGARPHWRRLRPASVALTAIWVIMLLAFALLFGLPLLWLLLAPTKTDAQVVNWDPISFGSFANIGTAWSNLMSYNDRELLTWLKNSLIYAASALVLVVALCLTAGYALGTVRFRGRSTLLLLTLIAMIMPAAALVLPVFLEINAVHLQNTAWSVILPSAFYPFGVYLAYIYYSTQLPAELLAAGRIDGCSEARLFWSIALPLARPIIAMVAFFSFTFNWQNFYLPYVMLADDTKYPLTVGLMSLIQSTPAINPAVGAGSTLNIYRPEIALAGIVVVLPIAIIFVFAQRFVVAGTLSGAEKG